MDFPTHDSCRLARDNGHELHVERHGTRGGIPTVILHGGPGGGLSHSALRTLDPDLHDVILFDQRGCGRSTPLGSITANTTADLIGDIEAIREHFGFDRWMVMGGSWGSTLSLAYAQAHPDRVLALRVHGVFLAGKTDIDWWFQGVRAVFPDAWDVFAGHVAPSERDDLLAAYYRRLTSDDAAAVDAAGWHLRNFSARSQTLEHDETHIATLLSSPDKYVPISRLFTHYCTHRAFMRDGALIEGVARIRHIPAQIVQGRYDMVTPVRSAWELHKAWPEAEFTLVTLSNHTASPDMVEALRAATGRLVAQIQG